MRRRYSGSISFFTNSRAASRIARALLIQHEVVHLSLLQTAANCLSDYWRGNANSAPWVSGVTNAAWRTVKYSVRSPPC